MCFKQDDLKKKRLGAVFLKIAKDMNFFFAKIYNCEKRLNKNKGCPIVMP